MRILICDDEILSVDSIKALVTECFRKKDIIAEVVTQTDSEKEINEKTPYDMAFLDIEMPNCNGLELAKSLLSLNPNTIIFIITSHEKYLDEAMDLRVFRFLPKPLDRERIFNGLNSAIQYYNANTRVVLTDKSTAHRVYLNDILYITIYKRKTLVITKNGEMFSDKSLSEWKKILPSSTFALAHYSFLVNLKNVERIEKDTAIMRTGSGEEVSVEISQRRYKEFKNLFFKYVSDGNF